MIIKLKESPILSGLTGIKTKVNQTKEQKSQTRTPPAGSHIFCRERVSIHSSIAGTRRDVRNLSSVKQDI
jgi:hypothetical protein